MNDKDAITDAVAAGVVSGGVTLAVTAAIVAAFVMHPALGLTLIVGAIMFAVAWLALALSWTAIKGMFRWLGGLIGIDATRLARAPHHDLAPPDPATLRQVETVVWRGAVIVCASLVAVASLGGGFGGFAGCAVISAVILAPLRLSMTTRPKLFGRVAAAKSGPA